METKKEKLKTYKDLTAWQKSYSLCLQIYKLAKIVLSKPNLKGLWIIGAVANFTDIYETLSGVIEGIRSIEKKTGKKFDFPIIIRRGGPREKEAFSMLKEVKDLNIKFSGREISIAESAKIVMEETRKYIHTRQKIKSFGQ